MKLRNVKLNAVKKIIYLYIFFKYFGPSMLVLQYVCRYVVALFFLTHFYVKNYDGRILLLPA